MEMVRGIPYFLIFILVILFACLIGTVLLAAIVIGIILIVKYAKKKNEAETSNDTGIRDNNG